MRYHVNVVKAGTGLVMGVTLLILGSVAVFLHYWMFALLSLILCGAYLFCASLYSSVIALDSDGIRKFTMGHEVRHWDWDSIREFGVIGTRAFGSEKYRYNGTKYIYFSNKEMDEKERFKMCLEWPPKQCAYALYTEELMHEAMMRLDLEPVYCNTLEPERLTK